MNVYEGYDERNRKTYLIFVLPLKKSFTTIQCIYNKGNVSLEIVTVLLQDQLYTMDFSEFCYYDDIKV